MADRAIAPESEGARPVTRARRRRLAFVTAESDDSAIAAAAIVGERTTAKNGYSSPAVSGMPIAL